MAYRTERLAIPKASNKLRNEMLITAKERSIASKSKLKGHAHHYFVSPYKNSQLAARCGADVTRELDNLSQLSHAESMMALNTLSPLDTVQTKIGSDTSRSLPNEPHELTPHRDKLPAIVNIQHRKPQMRSQKDNSWLGPPNSIPPNKRSEHVAAFKTHTHTTRNAKHETESLVPTDVQSESETVAEPQQLLMDRFPHAARYHGYDDDADSSVSLYPSELSESTDTYSLSSETHFTQLRLIDRPYGKAFASPGTSLQLKSIAASTRFDDASERYSNNIMYQYGESITDSQSNMSANSQESRRKRVHFDPQVRDVSRENRSAPLVAQKHSNHDEPHSAEIKISLDITPASNSSMDQLPAVVEKFMIKSLPVLPSINRNAINLNNANVIYIKGDGKTPISGQVSSIPKPVFIPKNNMIDVSNHRGAGSSSPGRVHNPHKKMQPAVPQLSRVAEETSNPSLSPSPQLKNWKTTKPSSPQKVVPASTSTNVTQNTSQYSAANTSNTQSNSSTKTTSSKKVVSKKNVKTEPKKATSTKGKTKGRKGRSSGSSSRNSPSVDSPVNDVTDDAELREQRQREYAAAMLAVQQRMREFDMRYGKNGDHIEDDKDKYQSWFGKAIPPKSNVVAKPKPAKPK